MSKKQLQQMGCMDVWSGSHFTYGGVEFGGMEAWLYSKPFGEARRGGDVFYASSCATGRITRLLLADVAGHGKTVAATAADLRLLMRRFVNCLDQTELVRSINAQFARFSGEEMFATAVVTTFFEPTRVLTVCNAGHPFPLVYRKKKQQWDFLKHGGSPSSRGPRNLPLGILSISDYDQFDVELEVDDCVVMYTDALIESQDANGERLGGDGLLRITRLLGDVEAPDLIRTLVGEIEDRYPENLSNDDVSILVFRVSEKKLEHSRKEKLSAFRRFMLTLIRAIDPAAERPPLPDLNLPNIGGAIVGSPFDRRWRGSTPVRLTPNSAETWK